MTLNCILAGVGGQGTVLASRLIAAAAMRNGLRVRTAETIGMAQRGGCVLSHVKVSSEEIYSPLITPKTAHVLIGFEPAEAVRNLSYLMDGGVCVVSTHAVMPVTASLGGITLNAKDACEYLASRNIRLITVDTDSLCAAVGSDKIMNTALLGAAAGAGVPGISVQELRVELERAVKPQYLQMNLTALELGFERAGGR